MSANIKEKLKPFLRQFKKKNMYRLTLSQTIHLRDDCQYYSSHNGNTLDSTNEI